MNFDIMPLTVYLGKESGAGLRMKIKGIVYDSKYIEQRQDTLFLRPLTPD
jgi:hypothetical protein